MSDSISAIRVAATTGIIGSAYIAGNIAGLSMMAVPGMVAGLVPPQELARQWETMFSIGKNLGPGMALFTLLPYGYAAYQRRARRLDGWRGYAAAGVLTLAIVPYTLLVMRPTNNALLAAAAGATRALGDGAVKELLGRWKVLNLVRSFLPLAGSVIGLSTLLS